MTLNEIINDVNMYLTMSGALPRILPDAEIQRIIEIEALPYFYEHDTDSLMMEYLYVPYTSFVIDPTTKQKSVILPCHTQYITWIYRMDRSTLFELGVSAPNLSVNMGTSTSQYLSSYTTTVGELGVYKVIIDGFADMLNQLTKFTLKHHFNRVSKQLNILTSMGHDPYADNTSNIVLEIYGNIPEEDTFEMPDFRDFVKAKSMLALGRLLTRYGYKMPGDVTINGDNILTDGKELLTEVKERIKGKNNNGGWFWMVKR